MAGSLSLGPSGHPDLLLHWPPACLFSHPLACSVRGIPRRSWLLYLVACFTSGSKHLCLPHPFCRYLFVFSLTSVDSSFVERKGDFESGREDAVFVGSLQSLSPKLLAAQANSGLGIKLGWSQGPPLMPVCLPGGSRLPTAPALALPV